MRPIPLKTINYRGGVVRFRIPADWVEEYEDAGGGTFYKPGDDGTLRLEVLTLKPPNENTARAESASEVLQSLSAGNGVPVVPRISLLQVDVNELDRGQPIKRRCWHVAQALPPANIRLALFSYTHLAYQFDSPPVADQLEMLTREILAAEFALDIGQTPPKAKPWWNIW